MDSIPSPDSGSAPLFSPDQYLVGIIRHQQTGAFVVFLSLDGNDIQQVAAHFDEATALAVYADVHQALPETYAEQRVREMLSGHPDGPEEQEAMTQDWVERIRRWHEASDAPFLPFPPDQLAGIGESIQQAFRARENQLSLSAGTVRTTELLPSGVSRTTLRPMPPPGKWRNKR